MLAECSGEQLFRLRCDLEDRSGWREDRILDLTESFLQRYQSGDGLQGPEATAVENALFNSTVHNCEVVQRLEFQIETAANDEQLISAARALRRFRQSVTRRAAECWAREQA